jgi:hypothetical protein
LLDEPEGCADDGLVVLRRRTKPAGGPRTLVGLACMLTALGLGGGTAGAQLPELPRTDPLRDQPARQLAEPVRQVAEPLRLGEPVRQMAEPLQLDEPVARLVEPLQQIVQEPLPGPLEEVVQESPLEPVRAEVRRIVGNPGGGVPGEDPTGLLPRGGSSADGNPSASDAGAGSPASPVSQASPGGEGGTEPGRTFRGGDSGGGSSSARAGGDGRADRTSGADDRGSETDSAGRGSGDAPDSAPATERTAGRGDASSAQEDSDGPIARTVERIVKVVPGFVWVALGVLALLALALFARSHVDRRRARALRRERERLLRDMGLLERVLLPRVPERMGDLAVSVAYRPAAGPAAGGDFYDVFELSGGRVGLFVGDVSGHGREALESTSSLRPAPTHPAECQVRMKAPILGRKSKRLQFLLDRLLQRLQRLVAFGNSDPHRPRPGRFGKRAGSFEFNEERGVPSGGTLHRLAYVVHVRIGDVAEKLQRQMQLFLVDPFHGRVGAPQPLDQCLGALLNGGNDRHCNERSNGFHAAASIRIWKYSHTVTHR